MYQLKHFFLNGVTFLKRDNKEITRIKVDTFDLQITDLSGVRSVVNEVNDLNHLTTQALDVEK
jgi:hypothetical protein